jgi:hypothetical protein
MNNLLWFSLMCWIFSRDKSSSSASSLSIADRLARMTPKERSIAIAKIMIAIILAVIGVALLFKGINTMAKATEEMVTRLSGVR